MQGEALRCPVCAREYPLVSGRPVLFAADNQLFDLADYADARPDEAIPSFRKTSVFGLSVNLSVDSMVPKLADMLGKTPATVLVVGGGRQRGWLDPLLRAATDHHVLYCDVDKWADVDFFCDAHDLPLADGSIDAVVTTAVLEHVLHPERVAAEIARVVRPGGLIYSELPFMQQVHEGAYDFTRFTLSGHRRLFNAFAEIETGMVAGPGTALAWAIENFLLSFFAGRLTRRAVKAINRVLFFWLKYTDLILARREQAMDGASCTYFFGSRSDSVRPDSDIIASYRGARHLQHV